MREHGTRIDVGWFFVLILKGVKQKKTASLQCKPANPVVHIAEKQFLSGIVWWVYLMLNPRPIIN